MRNEQTATAEITKQDAYRVIKKKLTENPEMLQDRKTAFEKAFGKDKESRTKKQWCNLVRVYGIELVSSSEKMDVGEIERLCNETFSQRLKRNQRKWNTATKE